ncbi:hypothetical protein, partial [Nitrosomonas ureae]
SQTRFVGGMGTPILRVCFYLLNTYLKTSTDPNTYIVFTTIIFVGVTVILAIAGYVLAQQFSESREIQEDRLFAVLKEQIKNNEPVGIALANAILDNSDVKRHLEDKLVSKIDEIIKTKMSETKWTTSPHQGAEEFFNKLSSKLNENGES